MAEQILVQVMRKVSAAEGGSQMVPDLIPLAEASGDLAAEARITSLEQEMAALLARVAALEADHG